MRAFDEPRPRPVPATRELWPAIRNVYAGMSPAARRTYRSILWATIRRRSVVAIGGECDRCSIEWDGVPAPVRCPNCGRATIAAGYSLGALLVASGAIE